MKPDLHVACVSLIHQGYNTLEIVAELRAKFGLGESAEHELMLNVNRLRKEITEARACAQQCAEEAFRQGKSWKEVIAILERPALLASYEVVGFASKAQEKVQQEQEVLP